MGEDLKKRGCLAFVQQWRGFEKTRYGGLVGRVSGGKEKTSRLNGIFLLI